MWRYEDTRAGLRDALRLSSAMTLKSAVAGNNLGGGKGVIVVPTDAETPAGRDRRDVLLDFADTVDALRGAYITAEDVGTSAKDMEVISRGTKFAAGLSRRRGGSGDPSPWTALGVHAAIAASVERIYGSPSLKGRSVALVGLGHVGMRLAKELLRSGAKVLATDIDRAKRAEIIAAGGRWITPEKALTQPADVFAPCALGGVLTDETVAELQVPIVAGAANNQLADDNVAGNLATRGVLWAPDFVANAGGIINIDVELEKGGYDPKRARVRVKGIGDTMRRIYDDAEASGVPPLTAAMELARLRLAAAS
jgi:leucine dehydrogenase